MVRAGPACAEDIGDAALLGGLLAGLFRNLRSRLSNFDQPSRSTALVVLDSGAEEDSPIDGGSSRAISSCAPCTASSARDESSSACRWPCIKLDAGPWASALTAAAASAADATTVCTVLATRDVSAASENCSRRVRPSPRPRYRFQYRRLSLDLQQRHWRQLHCLPQLARCCSICSRASAAAHSA